MFELEPLKTFQGKQYWNVGDDHAWMNLSKCEGKQNLQRDVEFNADSVSAKFERSLTMNVWIQLNADF